MIDYILYIIFGILLIFSFTKFINIMHCNKKYEDNDTDLSGCEIAQNILETNNINNVYVIETKNPFEQGYNSNRKVIKLTSKLFNNTNVVSLVISSMISTYLIEEKNNKIIYIKNILRLTVDILSLLCWGAIILSLILRDMYVLKISIGSLICILIYNILTLNIHKEIINKTITNIEKEEIKIDNIEEIADIYNYYFVAQPFFAIVKLINIIK